MPQTLPTETLLSNNVNILLINEEASVWVFRHVSAAKRQVMHRKWVLPREKETDRLLCDT